MPNFTTAETYRDTLISQCPEPNRGLIAMISHDLKMTLGTLIGYEGLLREPSLSEIDKAEFLEGIQRAVERLEVIAQGMNLYAGHESQV